MNIAAPRILAIDDASENLESLETAVKHVFPDAAFFAAQSASKGLELALSRDPDVILLDVVMPEMDGFEVCRRIKEDARLRNIPVAMITAIQPDKAICEKAFDSGAEAFITKPLELWDLAVQIRAMLKLKTANISQQAEQGRLQEMVARRTRELAEELASREKALEKLAEAEGNDILSNALVFYKKNKYLTPKFAFVVLWRLQSNKIDHSPSFFKVNLQKDKYQRDLREMPLSRVHVIWPALSSAQRKKAIAMGHQAPNDA